MILPSSDRWGRRNLRLLALFGPILVATGVAGLLLPPPPPGLAPMMMSNARPYDAFHIAFGLLGIGLVVARRARAAALFNLGFGAFDLYQAGAGWLGIFPSGVFELRTEDGGQRAAQPEVFHHHDAPTRHRAVGGDVQRHLQARERAVPARSRLRE